MDGNKKKIYGPIILHIYDTATDAGVLYYWYTLMIEEQNGKNYNSVNMTVFFWTGIAFVIVYRAGTVLAVAALICTGDEVYHLYDFPLILLDVFVFRLIYISAMKAQPIIAKNVEKRIKKKKNKEQKNQLELQVKNANTDQQNDENKQQKIEIWKLKRKRKLNLISYDEQMSVQLMEEILY